MTFSELKVGDKFTWEGERYAQMKRLFTKTETYQAETHQFNAIDTLRSFYFFTDDANVTLVE